MNRYDILYILFLFLFSCEKIIELNLQSDQKQLVVEGYIQPGFPAYVFITQSESYFNTIDSNTLNNIAVSNADVFVERNDGVVHKLTYIDDKIYDSLGFIDLIDFPIGGFYLDVNYLEDDFSQSGFKYKLKIIVNEDTITANTSIPFQYPIDSIWVELKDSMSEYKCYIWAAINDPDTLGNSIMIQFKRDVGWKPMDPLFIESAIPLRNDNIFNGNRFNIFVSRSGRISDDDGVLLPFYSDRIVDDQFIRKDIVLLRISHIDLQTYFFWRGVFRSEDMNGNPFTEPMNLIGNVKGALGTWGGYGTSYYYVPIVKDTVIYEKYNDVSILEMF